MEASALPRAATSRVPLSATFLRLRSDDQLVSLFRAGSDDAFSVIHERYHARLLAYSRQMLRSSGGDAEDALQDVFVRAFKSLRASNRPILLRAWLYRIAHNRCIDELRRPTPVPTELESDARPALASGASMQEPPVVAERSEALSRLLADVRTLPAPQRSALLMRELQGLSYQELSQTLEVSVPAVKSLLLRARTGLVDLKIAREAPCADIRLDLADAADAGARMSARSRRHVRECEQCSAFNRRQRDVRKHLGALLPMGPLGKLLGLFGLGGGGGATGGVAAGGTAAGGVSTAGGAGVIGGLTAAKVAAVVATAAVIGGAGTAAVQISSTPTRPAQSLAALLPGATQIAASTGATVAPAAPSPSTGPAGATTDAGGPPPQILIAALGATGSTDSTTSGATGPAGTTGASGPSGTGGSTDTGGVTQPASPAVVQTPPSEAPAAGTTGPTATVASDGGGPSGASGVSGTTGATGGR